MKYPGADALELAQAGLVTTDASRGHLDSNFHVTGRALGECTLTLSSGTGTGDLKSWRHGCLTLRSHRFSSSSTSIAGPLASWGGSVAGGAKRVMPSATKGIPVRSVASRSERSSTNGRMPRSVAQRSRYSLLPIPWRPTISAGRPASRVMSRRRPSAGPIAVALFASSITMRGKLASGGRRIEVSEVREEARGRGPRPPSRSRRPAPRARRPGPCRRASGTAWGRRPRGS